MTVRPIDFLFVHFSMWVFTVCLLYTSDAADDTPCVSSGSSDDYMIHLFGFVIFLVVCRSEKAMTVRPMDFLFVHFSMLSLIHI